MVAIHRSHMTASLFQRSGLLLPDILKNQLMQFVRHRYPDYVRHTQIDHAQWHSHQVQLKHLNDPDSQREAHFNRHPLDFFAYEIYLDFADTQRISLADLICQQLFPGNQINKLYQVTPNSFPYYASKEIQHQVIWINPAYAANNNAEKLQEVITQQMQLTAANSLIFENEPKNRSIPSVMHFQLLRRY